MNLSIPFLIALLTGGFIFGAIYKKNPWKDALGILISFWLGLAGCAMVVFYSILITNRYESLNVVIAIFIFIIFCCLLCYYRQGRPFLCYQGLGKIPWFQFFLLILVAGVLMHGYSYHKLYGEWDGWSLWNFRARYLVLAQTHWRDVYTYGLHAKHPWLLPYWIIFGWAWLGEQSYFVPFLSAQIFSLIVLATVFFSVLHLTKNGNVSLLAAIWLASISRFWELSISQCADVLVASLIVLNIMLLIRLCQQKTRADAVTLGLMLGVLSFCKDEGIVSASLIIVLLILLLRKCKNLYFPFCLALGLTLVPTLFDKYWMLPAPPGENTVYFLHIIEWKRWVYIIEYFMTDLSRTHYGEVWIIPLCLLVSRLLKPFNEKDRLMAGFLMMFIIVFFFLYVIVSDHLHWRLWTTSDRLVFQILPLGIVFLFYRLFGTTSK